MRLLKFKSLLLSLLLLQQAFSAVPVYKDSTPVAKAARLSQQQFLDTYGTDDTSRALIRYYFKKNKRARQSVLIWATAGLAAGFTFDQVLLRRFVCRPFVRICYLY